MLCPYRKRTFFKQVNDNETVTEEFFMLCVMGDCPFYKEKRNGKAFCKRAERDSYNDD